MIGDVNMKNSKKKFGDYFLGIDAGSDSLGWAVTDENYILQKLNGKAMWGVRLFDAAVPAKDRRTFRTARRRRGRQIERIKLLQELFAEPVAERDPGFFQRMQESKYLVEDKFVKQPNTLFNDSDYKDIDYHRKYMTVYHLRKALIDETTASSITDVRLLYLAVHHILCHRGHFLFEGIDLSDVTEFSTSFDALNNYLSNEYESDFSEADTETLQECLKSKLGMKEKKKQLYGILGCTETRTKKMADLLAGSKGVKLADLFDDESLEDAEISKVDFCTSIMDEKYDVLSNILQDRIMLLDYLKAVYDWAVLADILNGQKYISYAKVKCYDDHGKDLQILKDTIHELCPERYADMFKNPNVKGNYCTYSGMCKIGGKKVAVVKRAQKDQFYKTVESVLKDFDTPEVIKIRQKIEAGTFMPKQVSNSNCNIPYQENEAELKAILKNAEANFPFLNETDENGLTVSDKILKLLTFRIPYYVGPLNDAHKDSGNCWIVKRDGVKVTPWNFDEVVDRNQSAERFIRRMTNKCTYLVGEDVLPKDSLLYSEYNMLNELNNMKIDGEHISAEDKQGIISDLFERKNRVRIKDIVNYYKKSGRIITAENISGLNGDFKSSLKSQIAFKRILSERFDREAVEEAIKAIVLLGNDRKMLISRLKTIGDGYFTEAEINAISRLKYADWGRLSEKLLTGIYDVDKSTGECNSIIDMMRSTDRNFMQLMSSQYGFKKEIDRQNAEINGEVGEFTYDALVKDTYASPAVKRAIWQILVVTREIVKVTGHPPKKIFMEMAREEGEKKQTVSRKNRLIELYKKCKEDTRELMETLETKSDSDLRSKRLYLYYTQLGRCMYSGKEITLSQLYNKELYDIDHIYPQSKTKDDSLDNLVLVKKELNGKKSDKSLASSGVVTPTARERWNVLYNSGLITKEKFERLNRKTDLTDEELSGFIARQLVETRQSTKAAAEILSRVYPETRLVYSRATNVDVFKKKFEITKVREVNDYHHARDAYLNIVVGNVFDVKFTTNPMNFINSGEKYSLNDVMYDHDVRRGGRTAWIKGADGTIKTVKKVCGRENNILFTCLSYEQKGGLFDQQILRKGNGQFPTKLSDPHMKGQSYEEWISKYGGYNKVSGAYFCLVEHEGKKGKRVRSIESVPVYLANDIERDSALLERYLIEKGLKAPDVRIRKIKMNTLFSYNGFLMNVTGRTGERLLCKPAVQLRLSPEDYNYAKNIVKFHDRQLVLKKELTVTEFDGITAEENNRLYGVFAHKLSTFPYNAVHTTPAKVFENGREIFENLSLENQAKLLYEALHLFQCNRINADLTLIGGAKNSGIVLLTKNLSAKNKLYIVNQSPTGLFEQYVDLMTV